MERRDPVASSSVASSNPQQAPPPTSAETSTLDQPPPTTPAADITCDRARPFLAPTQVLGLDDGRDVYSVRVSASETSAYLSIATGATSGVDMFVADRATTAAPFVYTRELTELRTNQDDYWPSPSDDGRTLFFETSAPLTPGGDLSPRVWLATRGATTEPFGQPLVLGALLDGVTRSAPYPAPLTRTLYFAAASVGTRPSISAADFTDFGVVTGFRQLVADSTADLNMPVATYDDRALFYSRENPSGERDVWVVGRDSVEAPFGLPQRVVELSTSSDEYPASVSADGCRLYFISNRSVAGVARYRVWVAEKPPI